MQYFNLNKDFNDIDDYYEVEKIITRKSKGKNKLYLIKWFGYPLKDCTWEPISHLYKIQTLVEQFDDNYPYSIDKRQLRKYLHTINKGNKHRFINRNIIIPKRTQKKETNKNYNILNNSFVNSNSKREMIEIDKSNEETSTIESIEIAEEKRDNNISDEVILELNEENNNNKLIKPIIIW